MPHSCQNIWIFEIVMKLISGMIEVFLGLSQFVDHRRIVGKVREFDASRLRTVVF